MLSELVWVRLATVLVLSAMALVACGDPPDSDLEVTTIVNKAADRAIREGNIQGLVVVVAQRGSVVLERGYGRANIQGDVAMNIGTVLDYYSLGKHITAAILLRLAEQGEFDLDLPASRYLPEADFKGADVTVRQLLSHTSGLWEEEKDENELPAEFGEPPPEGAILEWANQSERLTNPGEAWMYSNGGYLFAGEIAERLTGETLENLIVNELASPLGLSSLAGCADMASNRVPGYFYEAGEVHPIAHVDPEWWGGSGTVCGTGGDLMRWWLALRSGRVLSADSLDQMFRPSRLRRNGSAALFGYGLGIRMGEFWGHSKIGHTGSGSGGTAILAEYSAASLVVLTIVNTAGDGVLDASDIEAEISSALLGTRDKTYGDTNALGDLARAAPGLYRSPLGEICIREEGSELVRSIESSEPEYMRHVGDGRFVTAFGGGSVGVEYFLGTESGPAQWFGFDYNGFPQDLAWRIGDECG